MLFDFNIWSSTTWWVYVVR